MELGTYGVWQPGYATTPEMAAKIEALGFSTLWLGGPDPALDGIDDLLAATDSLVVGTSIYNIYRGDPATLAASYRRIEQRFPGRLLLGIGVGHPEQTAGYVRPMAALSDFLDALDTHGVPVENRALAALGPKMLEVARDRTGGAVPYLVTPEHTRRARAALGPDKLLAPEQKVVLEPEAERARALARPRIKHPYLGLVNYRNNLRRLGFSDADLAEDGSDRLIDALAVHGRPEQVAAGLQAHLDAGADHVQIHLVTENSAPHPAMPEVLLQVYDDAAFRAYTALAQALGITP
ncbi:LLM class F420-dependent oxidoreductase [Mycobacterium sp. Root265]|uniref:TIGR03620 family F420-dependent LLM class oxidoreductase n=1 Tax=Mycobacterium sp. Root265 TaxID=1736504 RepID=UPI000710CCC8|nr:TIGR03620 family F420-dependent LLM class oxidoreductase [Mycobacterium sp. Root265]KRD19806.1 LLM class F420-dependent oxidoreductase [Mycobacterium sp. Root265]